MRPQRSDAECADQARRGDEPAFADLIRRHQKAVFQFAFRLLADADEADDVTQETFIRAFRYLGSYDRGKPFRSWLMGIAMRQCATAARKKDRRRESPLDDDTIDARSDLATLTATASDEMSHALCAAILRLPLKQRAAFVLFAHEERSMDEIAQILNCSIGTVKTHIHRARLRLRIELSHLTGGGDLHALSPSTQRAEPGARRSKPSAPSIAARPCLKLQRMP